MTNTTIREISRPTMFGRAFRAEITKAFSVGYLVATLVVVAVVSFAASAAIGLIASNSQVQWGTGEGLLRPEFALVGLLTIGVMILLIGSAWLVLGEFVPHTAGATALAVSDRVVVLLAKALLAGVVVTVATYVLVGGALVIAESAYRGALTLPDQFIAAGPDRIVAVLPLVFGCFAAMSVGVAAVIRNVPVTIAVIVIWYFAAEDFVRRVPGVGPAIADYLPVSNGLALAGVQGDLEVRPGGIALASAVLAITVAGVLAIASWSVASRDVRT